MRNTDDIKPQRPAEFSPGYILWAAKYHIEMLKLRHTAAMQEAGNVADEITRFEGYVAELEQGEKP
ncbi:MAG: hypothetical protein V3W41_12870 [Planctomycetota bacterium]